MNPETPPDIGPIAAAPTEPKPSPGRIVSIDAYRGLVMILMASAIGEGFSALSQKDPSNIPLNVLTLQFEHLEWRGITIWDMIQPSFMFLVGVSLPFSMAARSAKGQGWWRQFGHALTRSLILVAMGVFLASGGAPQTNWTFTNVLAQIGLGYPVLFLAARWRPSFQVSLILAILVGYWAWFAAYPLPDARLEREPDPPVAERPGSGQPEDDQRRLPFEYHWAKHTNAAARFDRTFLNLFPVPDGRVFEINPGGYTTLNFVPSIATMLLGLLAGQILAGDTDPRRKLVRLFLAGAPCILIGTLLDTSILDVTLCPMVKRIWTPSWALMSGGVAFVVLGLFYATTDAVRIRSWVFPLVIVGTNSIAFYLMAQLIKPWIRSTLRTHLTTLMYILATGGAFPKGTTVRIAPSGMLFPGNAGTLLDHLAITAALWLIALWMYRRKIFLRV